MKVELTSVLCKYNELIIQYPLLRLFSPSYENSRLYIDIDIENNDLWLLVNALSEHIIIVNTEDNKKQIQIYNNKM